MLLARERSVRGGRRDGHQVLPLPYQLLPSASSGCLWKAHRTCGGHSRCEPLPQKREAAAARGGPTVSSAGPATKLKPARTQTQNGLLSTQPTHRKTSAFYSTIRVGGWSGETPTVISAGHPTLEMESDGFVFKASLKCAHTDTRARFVCVCACMCTHMYKCLRMYAYIDMSN